MSYLSIPEAAVLWHTTSAVLRRECEAKRISGAVRFGWRWWIPAGAERPRTLSAPPAQDGTYA